MHHNTHARPPDTQAPRPERLIKPLFTLASPSLRLVRHTSRHDARSPPAWANPPASHCAAPWHAQISAKPAGCLPAATASCPPHIESSVQNNGDNERRSTPGPCLCLPHKHRSAQIITWNAHDQASSSPCLCAPHHKKLWHIRPAKKVCTASALPAPTVP